MYAENTFERSLERKAIVEMLKDEAEPEPRALKGLAFTKPAQDENFLTLIAHFDTPHQPKTIALLYPGSQLPIVAAMSGWAHQGDRKSQRRYPVSRPICKDCEGFVRKVKDALGLAITVVGSSPANSYQ